VSDSPDLDERRLSGDPVGEFALRDFLTGLSNRALLMDRLQVSLAQARRTGEMLAVLFCDLDEFKIVNNSVSHHVGDLALVEVGRRLELAVRETDTVARCGGDEFVVVCGGLSAAADASRIARDLRDALGVPMILNGIEATLSVSIGIVTVEGFAAWDTDPTTMLRDADAAMYRAKQAGGARWAHFDESQLEDRGQRVELEPDLRRALAREELVLHYQPIVRLADRAVVGAEALLRWRHPVRGLLGPDQFVSIAEESGLVVPIGEWVLREACGQARRLRQSVDWRGWMSVNVSPRQVAQPGLSSSIAAILDQTGTEPDSLWLELTETALLLTGHAASVELLAMRALGVHVGIDDFGTGYASIASLQRLPIDFLKIDHSFVTGLTQSSSASAPAIVAATIQLSSALGLRTIAEGIESEAQVDLLLAYGCEYGQGFLLGRSVPVEEFTELVRA
jgi:diguanylate cyclase (GGDEF)-like protein